MVYGHIRCRFHHGMKDTIHTFISHMIFLKSDQELLTIYRVISTGANWQLAPVPTNESEISTTNGGTKKSIFEKNNTMIDKHIVHAQNTGGGPRA